MPLCGPSSWQHSSLRLHTMPTVTKVDIKHFLLGLHRYRYGVGTQVITGNFTADFSTAMEQPKIRKWFDVCKDDYTWGNETTSYYCSCIDQHTWGNETTSRNRNRAFKRLRCRAKNQKQKNKNKPPTKKKTPRKKIERKKRRKRLHSVSNLHL